jgi:hypothetical protein
VPANASKFTQPVSKEIKLAPSATKEDYKAAYIAQREADKNK